MDPLLPKSENVAVIIEPPTDEEVNAAITGNMGHLVTVVSVRRFLYTFITMTFKVLKMEFLLVLIKTLY